MEKLQFEFTLLPGTDGKSNIFSITSIATNENKVYKIPEELQSANLHKELMKTSAFTKAKNSLKKRHQIRKVWITMTDPLAKTYIDEDGNLQFCDQFLEEINQEDYTAAKKTQPGTLERLIEKLVEYSAK